MTLVTPEHLLDLLVLFEGQQLLVCLLWDLHDLPDLADEDPMTLAEWMVPGEDLNQPCVPVEGLAGVPWDPVEGLADFPWGPVEGLADFPQGLVEGHVDCP